MLLAKGDFNRKSNRRFPALLAVALALAGQSFEPPGDIGNLRLLPRRYVQLLERAAAVSVRARRQTVAGSWQLEPYDQRCRG